MFGRRFARQFAGLEREFRRGMRGGHHHRHGWGGPFTPNPRAFGWRMGPKFFKRGGPFGPRGPFGPGGPFAPGRPFGPGGPGGEDDFFGGRAPGKHFFGRGDLKYALLELLQERPMHGYEMMKALQERTGGRYTPSAGSVYPTLQMLQDRDLVTVSEADGKKVYSITDAGRAFLEEGRPEERGERGRGGFWHGPEGDWADVAAVAQELRQLGPLFMSAMHGARQDPEKLRRLKKVLEQVRRDLAAIAGDAGPVNL